MKFRSQNRVIYAYVAIIVIQGCTSVFAASTDVTDIPFEHLIQTDIITASRIGQQISNAPSAVSTVTAEDIRKFGYRTLADIIGSMRGLYTTNDRTYTYMGGRGFGRTGDYAGRVMLLIDGYQANDNLYNAAYLGNDGLLDAELIDRVEYVSGPGGVTYGNGAFYGIINVITKKGSDINGVQTALDAGSFGSQKERVTYGKTLANGLNILLSASRFASDGQTHYYPEFDSPATNNGRAENLDDERNRRFFGKLIFDKWTLIGAFVSRRKSDPTAQFGADFNVSPNWIQDSNGFIDLKYDADFNAQHKASYRTYYGQYQYRSRAVFTGEFYSEKNMGRWWGAEAKFTNTSIANHKLLYGVEYRNDYQQDFYLPDASLEHSQYLISGYTQDEYQWLRNVRLNMGARYDYGGKNATFVSPRVAAIYSATEETDVKVSYASAFRRPNVYEKYYSDPSFLLPNRNLRKETVDATELVIESRPDSQTKIQNSFFYYTTQNLISASEVGGPGIIQYGNWDKAITRGADIELDHFWKSGMHLKTSYAWQLVEDGNGQWMVNSPRHLFKSNFSMPLLSNQLYLGVELQSFGKRLSEQRNDIAGYSLVNVSLSSTHLIPHVNVSATVRNLFDRDYAIAASGFNAQETILQDGRNIWLQMVYQWP
ncbi:MULTISPECIES: TonB-dependent siderophore receptor [unclassified Methylophilus]|uniref:TonB-dependent receptor plug domain-containing protein n=1 Tax=unclassified Methylophilus TaxID=2630143 RepID=UPI0006FD750C|nr:MULTISPECIES: TonB-dependent receptor [unclassified Methylophilus]KQT43944.1 TonB-dependent receptor [Methylophilus sp. Leaf416]KQT59428.1 TonB-dependent receptor [Methylophilus sp. Leaf459]